MGILNNTLKPTLAHRFSTIRVYNALVLPFFYMESKFGALEKKIKTIEINQDEAFRRTARYALLDHKRNEEILEELEVEPVDE